MEFLENTPDIFFQNKFLIFPNSIGIDIPMYKYNLTIYIQNFPFRRRVSLQYPITNQFHESPPALLGIQHSEKNGGNVPGVGESGHLM